MAYVTLRRSPWIKTAQFFAYIAPLLMFSAEGRAVSIEDVSKALELVSKTVDLADKTFTSGSTTDANVSTTFDAKVGTTSESFSGSVTASAQADVKGRFADSATAFAHLPFDIRIKVNQPGLKELDISYSWFLKASANSNDDNVVRSNTNPQIE